MNALTNEEKLTNYETLSHIKNVSVLLTEMSKKLIDRASEHDNSKLVSPEVEIFTEFTPKLSKCTYGSDEYNEYLKEMKVALDHHYSKNSHHPEHYENGINDMDILDLFEMLCDWKAATLRHNDGDIYKSIEINSKRFGYGEQLKKILLNTVPLLNSVKLKDQHSN